MAKPSYCDYIFKLLFVGDSAVGKSCLIIKYCDNTFQESFITTVGIDFKIKTVEVCGKRIKLQIWDTAGQERFQTITASYYRSANAIFLTYDITCVASFNHVANWLRQIQANAPDDVCKMLIGNKCDKNDLRQVTTERGKRLASDFNMMFCETSAKTGENIEKAFLEVAMVLLNKQTATSGSNSSYRQQAADAKYNGNGTLQTGAVTLRSSINRGNNYYQYNNNNNNRRNNTPSSASRKMPTRCC